MSFKIQIQLNEKLYVRDPSQTEVGRNIIKHGATMIEKLGFENFTLKKLANKLKTNESSIYRYFANKHRLLLYLVDWYWRWIEYLVMVHTKNIQDPYKKIDIILDILLLKVDDDWAGGPELDKNILNQLVIKEGSKAYLTNHVSADNKQQLFKSYKDLCARVAGIFLEINPKYRYSRSLTTTVIEMVHYQYFFMHNLPRLTDFGDTKDESEIINFMKELIKSSLSSSIHP
jgi:AcrR family transcriptional regulator